MATEIIPCELHEEVRGPPGGLYSTQHLFSFMNSAVLNEAKVLQEPCHALITNTIRQHMCKRCRGRRQL